ncbi:MAG: hypothetical protein AAGE52_04400 [Myxococcota bacterium]
MAAHLFASGVDAEQVVDVVTRACVRAGYELAATPSSPWTSIEVAGFADGTELRLSFVPRTLSETIARELGKVAPRIELAECDVPSGRRGEGVTSRGLSIQDGAAVETDLTGAAEDLLHEWSDGEPVYDEAGAEQLLAAALVNRNPDGFKPGNRLFLHRKPVGRVDELEASLRGGASFSWTSVGGKPALKVDDGSGARRVAVLSEDEAEALRRITEELSR